jgi:hypothetical protein
MNILFDIFFSQIGIPGPQGIPGQKGEPGMNISFFHKEIHYNLFVLV